MRAQDPWRIVVILLLSSDRRTMAQVAGRLFGGAQVQFVSANEVQRGSLGELLKKLRRIEAEVFAIGVKDLRPHQYPSLLKGLALLPRAKGRMLVDEGGRILPCTFLRFIAHDMPLLVVKLLAAIPLVIASYLIVLLLRGYLGTRWKGPFRQRP